ncbi:MAG: DUF5414 family protein [Chlamydiales bacterium]
MSEQIRKKMVFDEQMILLFEGNMRRIFSMTITPSTYREIQNSILNCVNQNKDLGNFFFETLLTGQIKVSIPNEKHYEILEDVIKHFTIPARLAKEVYERGEFVNIITSDVIKQDQAPILLNRVRRIDGKEFVFMSNVQNTVELIQHFVHRLCEMSHQEKNKEILCKYKKEIETITESLKQCTL